MIDDRRVLALIPARGGSKGIKGKNIIPLCGKPLIGYTIQAALGSGYVDRVLVTTDSEEIAEASRQLGADAPFLRPERLASDTAKTIDAVLHAMEWLRSHGEAYDILTLLQPTQPLRRAEDIDGALEAFMAGGMQGLASVREAEEMPPLMRTLDSEGRLKGLLPMGSTIRRQEMEKYYLVDGSIYINATEELGEDISFNDNAIPYLMPTERSVDIDEWKDLERAELLLKRAPAGKKETKSGSGDTLSGQDAGV